MNEITKKRVVGGGVLAIALLVGPPGRGEEWYYDWANGLAPWVEQCFAGNTYEIVDGELVMRPARPAPDYAYLRHEERRLAGDVSMRIQGRVVGPGRLWFAVHNPQCGDTYTAGFNSVNGNVSINLLANGVFEGGPRQPIEMFPDRDIHLQVDIRGARLEIRAWWDGQDQPAEAHVSWEDMTYRDGWVGIGFSSDGEAAPGERSYAIYRSVWICEGSDCDPGDVGERDESNGFFEGLEVIDTGLGGRICCQTTSADELVLYFSQWGPGGPRDNPDIYFMTRDSKDQPFVPPARPLNGLNTLSEDWVGAGSLSLDGEEIYFVSNRPGGFGSHDLWVARFNEQADGHGDPEQGFFDIENLGAGVNTAGWDSDPNISRDKLRLYFRSNAALFMVSRERPGALFGDRRIISNLGGGTIYGPAISPDELTVFWNDERAGGFGNRDIWMATRLGRSVSFDGPAIHLEPPIDLCPVNTGSWDAYPSLTADWPASGSGLYFSRGGSEILRASWHPDCNDNHRDDLEEITAGDADDLDANDIPDECEPEPMILRRGDSNADGVVNIADGVFTLVFLFAGGQEPPCLDAGDSDDSGQIDISDSIGTFNWLFHGAAPPAPPGPQDCGVDPTDDPLGCEADCQ